MDQEARPICVLPIKDPFQIKRHTQTENKEMGKDISCKWKWKKSWGKNTCIRQNKLQQEAKKDPAISILGIYLKKSKTLI